ncbi:MAG: PQQ-binding-like beta-propeller repeat protein [Chloroflexi bacterium]|nr:PQQ-binding-like beta-propeller repeat protein [Chloroflexota bacterium]MDA1173295.1 PQQ-binding-like beta-propeller repeat protein [Chloroflexota bacterium]
MKRPGSRFSRQLSMVVLLSLVAAVILAGCAGQRNIGASESWSGIVAQPETETVFVATRDGRVIELLLIPTSRGGIQPREGHVFDAQEREEGGDKQRVGVAFYGTPTIADGRLFVGSYQGFVYSLNVSEDGDVLGDVGSFEIDGNKLAKGISGDVIYADGALVVAAAEDTHLGRLYVLEAEELSAGRQNRIERCRYPLGEEVGVGRVWSSPLVVDGVAYFGDLDHFVHAVSIETCELVWSAPVELGASVVAAPVAIDGTLYVGAFDGIMYAIDMASGDKQEVFTADSWFWATPATDGNRIYAPNLDGVLYAYDTDTDSVAWTYDQEGSRDEILARPAVVDGNIMVGSDGGDVTLLDRDGIRIDDYALADDKVRAPLMVSGNTVYVRSLEEMITAFVVDGGIIEKDWEYKVEGF